MAEFRQAHTAEWLEYFARLGHPGVRPLGAGVEGAIYRLGDGTVAKVWAHRDPAELVRMQAFYADVARGGLPFDTPVILRVAEVEGSTVTYERELSGKPLPTNGFTVETASIAIEVLRALAQVPATGSMKALPVLGEQTPFWSHATFAESLCALLCRRVDRFGDLLSGLVPDFDRLFGQLLARLREIEPVPPTLVHGDLFGENILVDPSGRPSAVLDFGFVATAGDPRFDAAVTAMIMDMYSPRASAATQDLTNRIARELRYPIEVLLVYQAAYAVATSNSFTPDGSDGHFAWCVDQLRRPDVVGALAR